VEVAQAPVVEEVLVQPGLQPEQWKGRGARFAILYTPCSRLRRSNTICDIKECPVEGRGWCKQKG
jgi:hypothetical protein